VFHALQRLQAELPFRILGLDSDNGTEFINRAMLDYCTERGITFTRSRPYLKNDTCHVEQKNWAVVRRLVGYDRLELPALPALERIHDLARDYRDASRKDPTFGSWLPHIRIRPNGPGGKRALRCLVCSRSGWSARSTAAALMRATRCCTATGNSRNA
jgi:hypothetical protein